MEEVERPDSQMEGDVEAIKEDDGAMDLGQRADVITGVRRTVDELEAGLTDAEDFYTATIEEQEDVEATILGIFRARAMTAEWRPDEPRLLRDRHCLFLRRGVKYLSDAYEALDASRPWLCYWILHSMNLLGIKPSKEESIYISRFLDKCQDKEIGGFGGGPGQFSHLAATYAAVNALICLEIPEALAIINRDKLATFLRSMKLSDGSFRMHRGGEIDVRAAYCAVVVAKLTNLCSEDLFSGTAEWLAKCQTYEGGFGGSIGAEAHGGYTFCAAAALVLLQSSKTMDQGSLLKWLAGRQLRVEGGFQGRTNKLVDGCYSFWQGASFCLLGPDGIGFGVNNDIEEAHWLFNQTALQEYILMCCQNPGGGLIDKPGKPRDYYHTCYTLSGLSIAQHSPDGSKVMLGDTQNELKELHPVYNLTIDCVETALEYFTKPPNAIVVAEIQDNEEQEVISNDNEGAAQHA